MTATEELRRMLDERRVEWSDSSDESVLHTTWNAMSCWFNEFPDGWTAWGMAMRGTPKQAIAATLGRGTLTADDVRDLIERHSDASGGNGRDFHNGAYVAIADELNATLGSFNCTNSERTGTCHNASKVMDEHGQARFACSECHAWIDSRLLWNPEYRNGESPWVSDCKLNYCPNCGRRIVGPTTNDVDAEVTDG